MSQRSSAMASATACQLFPIFISSQSTYTRLRERGGSSRGPAFMLATNPPPTACRRRSSSAFRCAVARACVRRKRNGACVADSTSASSLISSTSTSTSEEGGEGVGEKEAELGRADVLIAASLRSATALSVVSRSPTTHQEDHQESSQRGKGYSRIWHPTVKWAEPAKPCAVI